MRRVEVSRQNHSVRAPSRGADPWGWLGLFCLLLLLTAPAARAQGDLSDVPDSLSAWAGWVLRDHPDIECPWTGTARQCAWPGRLELELTAREGRFLLAVRADREVELSLPGGASAWPRAVTVDGRPALMIRSDTGPVVRLEPGQHEVEGRFDWQRLPETLAVPPEIALVALTIEGRAVLRPRRERDGLLWLQTSRQRAAEEDTVQVEVHRRLIDGVPAQLETRIRLRVGGGSREIDLGTVLPAGFVPVRAVGALPVRLESDRRMRVQLQPGTWELDLLALHAAPLSSIERPAPVSPWPEDETWAYQSVPEIRVAQASGLQAVDPQRTNLPPAWSELPVYRFPHDSTLDLIEVRRGAADPPPDSVRSQRQLWLDYDGATYTVHDQLAGSLYRGGRLAPRSPAQLGSLSIDGVGQVLTVGQDEVVGVEIRAVDSQVEATLTYPRGGALPAVGWNRDAKSLSATLHLPSGWRLLAAPGVDRAAGSWIESWSLLDLFLLLLIVISGSRLLGRSWGAMALVALGLAWHQPWVPRVLWIVVLGGLALERWLVESGRLRVVEAEVEGPLIARLVRSLRRLACLVLVAQVLFFAGLELRTALFPHLEDRSVGRRGLSNPAAVLQGMAPEVRAELSDLAAEPEPSAPARESKKSSWRYDSQRSQQFDLDAVVQTGPGIPQWTGATAVLRWSGPVSAEHSFRLWLISPFVHGLLKFLFVALIALLVGRLFGFAARSDRPSESPAQPSLALGVLVFLLPLLPGPVRAQESEPAEVRDSVIATTVADSLDELEDWLTRPPRCGSTCVELSAARVEAGESLRVVLEAHAAVASTLPLPGPAQTWSPTEVEVDGRGSDALRREEDGYLRLRLDPGVHEIVLLGEATESLVLQFPLVPRVLEWSGVGWTAEGAGDDSNATLRLVRDRPLESSGAAAPQSALVPWVSLIRVLDLGIPWQVHNTLERRGNLDEALHLEVPLLSGERVATPGIPSSSTVAQVALAPGEAGRSWTSNLEESARLQLDAWPQGDWTETWVLECSPVWNCQPSGIAPASIYSEGRWRPVYRPWPGESLVIDLTRPDPASGDSTTIDSVSWTEKPGRRLAEGRLGVRFRSSRGGEVRWQLPPGAQIETFEINQQAQPAHFEPGSLVFSLPPGESFVSATWHRDGSLGLLERFPTLDLGMPAANLDYELAVPRNRWVLLTGGPRVGPVIGFWQYVLVLLLAAWVLEGWGATPLGRWDWFLLGLGLTQVPYLAALVVVGWFVALGHRGGGTRRPWRYNLSQLGFVGWALVASAVLYTAVHRGLLLSPDLHVSGANSSSSSLRWFADRTDGALDSPWALWLPLWIWRLVMLGWALWLASRLLGWLPWAWERMTKSGFWASRRPRSPAPASSQDD